MKNITRAPITQEVTELCYLRVACDRCTFIRGEKKQRNIFSLQREVRKQRKKQQVTELNLTSTPLSKQKTNTRKIIIFI